MDFKWFFPELSHLEKIMKKLGKKKNVAQNRHFKTNIGAFISLLNSKNSKLLQFNEKKKLFYLDQDVILSRNKEVCFRWKFFKAQNQTRIKLNFVMRPMILLAL